MKTNHIYGGIKTPWYKTPGLWFWLIAFIIVCMFIWQIEAGDDKTEPGEAESYQSAGPYPGYTCWLDLEQVLVVELYVQYWHTKALVSDKNTGEVRYVAAGALTNCRK